jgi:hypothetical protein
MFEQVGKLSGGDTSRVSREFEKNNIVPSWFVDGPTTP